MPAITKNTARHWKGGHIMSFSLGLTTGKKYYDGSAVQLNKSSGLLDNMGVRSDEEILGFISGWTENGTITEPDEREVQILIPDLIALPHDGNLVLPTGGIVNVYISNNGEFTLTRPVLGGTARFKTDGYYLCPYTGAEGTAKNLHLLRICPSNV